MEAVETALTAPGKVAVIADTHLRARGRLPAACRRELASAQLIVHAGDVVSAAVLQELRELGPPLHAVRGNVDEPDLADRLPERLELELDGARCGLVHDAGPSRGRLERLRAGFPGCAAVIFGHSHIPLHESRDGFQIFNPGSPTARRRQPRHTMGLLSARAGALRFELVALDGG
jgi:putative phosphoesterase